MSLLVHRIQRFSIHDGPGIRTTVFCQGCPLRCWWCHNPETQTTLPDDAQWHHTGELVDALMRDERYWRSSGGGVTFSGGEPLMQAAALMHALDALGARSVHRAIDTSGDIARDAVEAVDPLTDLWLWDIKSMDEDNYAEATGGDLAQTLDNLAWILAQSDTAVRVRVPVINRFSDDEKTIDAIAQWLLDQPRRAPLELLPGHDVGRCERTGGRAAVDASRVAAMNERLRAIGLEVCDADRNAIHA